MSIRLSLLESSVLHLLRRAFWHPRLPLRVEPQRDFPWPKLSGDIPVLKVGPDPGDEIIKKHFPGAEIVGRSPWFPRKLITCWITLEIIGPDGSIEKVELKPPHWHCDEN